MTRARSTGIVLFSLAVCGAGCGGGGTGPLSCTADEQCPTGGRCQAGACQQVLVVTITSPAQAATFCGTLRIEVAVSGGNAQAVTLLKDGKPLSTLAPPFQWDWETTETAATHELVARVSAGSQTYDSDARLAVVDCVQPRPPSLSVASPTSQQPVHVSGTAEAGAVVRVYDGAALVGQTQAEASEAWSVDIPFDPGPHQLTATATDAAGNASPATSPAVPLVVDRSSFSVGNTAPTGDNVWSRGTVTARFTKPVDPTTVTAQSFKASGLVDETGVSFEVAFKSLTVSSDGLTVTATPDPNLLPPVPSKVTARLTSGIRSLAGDALAETTWSWALPLWQSVGPAVSMSYPSSGRLLHSLALERAGNPVVAYELQHLALVGAQVARWDGASWSDLGSLVTVHALTGTGRPSVAIDGQGHTFVAWTEGSTGQPGVVYASKHDGSTWTPVGSALNHDTAIEAVGPILKVDSAGAPVVAWSELVGSVHHVFVKRWDGSAWQQYGDDLFNGATADVRDFSLTLDATGRPVVAWVEGGVITVARWMNSNLGWYRANVGTTLASPSVAVDGADHPVLAVVDTAANTVVVKRSNMTEPGPSGVLWVDLGGLGAGSHLPSLAIDPGGTLFVVYAIGSGVFAQAGKNATWNALGADLSTGTLAATILGPQIVVNAQGHIAVSWAEETVVYHALSAAVHVNRLNR